MAKIFIPNNLTRAQLDAFRSVEAELSKLADGVTTGSGPPIITSNLQDGSLYYDYTNLNLYVFNGVDNTWKGSATQLHIRYASNVTNINGSGNVPSASDVTDFSVQPYNASGVQFKFRGLHFGNIIASTDPTDYEWTLTSGSAPTFERRYSLTAGLLSEMGDPTNPGTGITWRTGTIPSTAYWIAERFTVDDVVSSWQVYPVQAKDSGIPFVSYIKSGYNKPALNSATWSADTVIAVSSFTGRSYTNQKEFGYGTVVVITYDNGKLAGKFKNVSGTDTWVAPGTLLDGDLIVDGTIATDKIQANSINASKLLITGTGAITASTISADVAGAAAAAITASTNALAVVTSNIYTTNTTEINGGKVTTGSILAGQIAADAVTSNKILMNGPIEFSSTSSGLHFNKSAFGDGLVGGFVGRHVTASGANAIGLDFTSATSSIRMSSGGSLVTKGILLETGIPGSSTEYSTAGTHTFTITTGVGSLISVVLTGGGGGGANNWVASFHPGNPGGSAGVNTTVAFLNSGGSVIGSVITASGGTGAGNTVSVNNANVYGVQGSASLHAQGGSGGGYNGTGGNGSRGSGGGGAGGSGNSGNAASLSPSGAGVSIADSLTVPSGAAYIRVIIGAGGAGGSTSSPSGTQAAGGNGGAGFASITPPASGSQLFDFEDLATNSVPWPTLGQMTTTSLGSLTNLGSGGAGWYYVAIINGNNGNGSAASFVGMPHYYSGTPTAGGTSAIWYKMK